MLDSFDKRLRCCRAAIGLKTKTIIDDIQAKGGELTINAYNRWESGAAKPVKKSKELELLIIIFKENGIATTIEWLLNGDGLPPQLFNIDLLSDSDLFYFASQNMKDSKLVQIAGTYGEPFVSFGEMVILSPHVDINNMNGRLCYITTKEKKIKIGVIEILDNEKILLRNKYTEEIFKIHIQELRKVRWIRKK